MSKTNHTPISQRARDIAYLKQVAHTDSWDHASLVLLVKTVFTDPCNARNGKFAVSVRELGNLATTVWDGACYITGKTLGGVEPVQVAWAFTAALTGEDDTSLDAFYAALNDGFRAHLFFHAHDTGIAPSWEAIKLAGEIFVDHENLEREMTQTLEAVMTPEAEADLARTIATLAKTQAPVENA